MPIEQVVNLVEGMELNEESINTWKNGVARTLRKYIASGIGPTDKSAPVVVRGLGVPRGCLICQSCGASKCG